jgi:hypothetical protein
MLSTHLAQTFQKLAINRAEKAGWADESFWDVISEDLDGHFVHFSDSTSLEITTRNTWDTPTGIYAYPLFGEMLSQIKRREVPFAGERNFAYIGFARGYGLLTSEYSENSLKKDLQKLQELFGDKVYAIKQSGARNDHPTTRLLYTIYKLVDKNSNAQRSLLKKLGYDFVFDDAGIGAIASGEPIQAVFLSRESFQVVKRFDFSVKKDTNLNAKMSAEKIEEILGRLPVIGNTDILEYLDILEGNIRRNADLDELDKIDFIKRISRYRNASKTNRTEAPDTQTLYGETPIFERNPRGLDNKIRQKAKRYIEAMLGVDGTAKAEAIESVSDWSEDRKKQLNQKVRDLLASKPNALSSFESLIHGE